MVAISEARVEAETETLTDKKPIGRVVLNLMRRKPLGAAGAVIVIIMILMAIFANLVAPYDPVANSFADMTQAPGLAHLLGSTARAVVNSANCDVLAVRVAKA